MSQQQSYNNLTLGFAGQLVGDDHRIQSLINDLGAVQQVDDITVTSAIDSTTYAFLVNGYTVSFTSGVGADIPTIRDGLIAAGRAIEALEGVVTFQPFGEKVRVLGAVMGTGMAVSETDGNLTLAHTTANVATATIPFGRAVVKNAGAYSTDQGCRLPSVASQIFMGVVCRIHSAVDPTNAGAGVKPFGMVDAMYQGEIIVEVDEAVAVGDDAFFRFTASATAAVGTFRNDADTATCDAISGGKFVSSTTGAGLAVLRLK